MTQISDESDRILVIINPAAKGEKASGLIDKVKSITNRADIKITAGPDDAYKISSKGVKEGYKTIVAAGGDGTVNQVVNGVAGSDVAFGILPLGTMNVFACELGLPALNIGLQSVKIEQAWQIIETGKTRRVDLPSANGRHFIQMAGIGLDAQVVQETDQGLRKTFGPLTYLVSATQIASRTPPKIKVVSKEGGNHEGSFVLIGNGRFYGGPFVLFNDAKLDDHKLDILIFKNLGYLDILRYLQGVVTGTHVDMKDVDYFQSESVEISSDDEVPVEIDGEVIGNLPYNFSIEKRPLNVIVP